MGDDDAEARRRARASWQSRLVSHEEASQSDALAWLAIPVDERAAFVWELSQEVFGRDIEELDTPARRRLRRSVVRVVYRKR